MLIVCPSCASEYVLDAARLAPEGRTVRCAGCRETFFVKPEPEAAAAIEGEVTSIAAGADDTAAGPAVVAPPRPRAAKRAKPGFKDRVRRVPTALWLALAALLSLMGLASARQGVVALAPQTARLYAAAGLPVNLRGLELRDVGAHATAGASAQLVVEGEVANVRSVAVAVPRLALELRDAHDDVAYRWTVDAPRGILQPAEAARFRAVLATPPAGADRVLVRFDAAPPEAPVESGADPVHKDSSPAPASGHGSHH